MRVSSHPLASLLAGGTGHPITSTSANLTGAPPASSAEQIDACLAARLDLVLDGGPSPGGPASTILDLTGPRPTILRRGSVTADRIGRVLGFRPREAAAA